MLGRGKISSESPNVIDLGDCAPSRPSRPERSSYSDNPEQVVVRGRSLYLDRDDQRPSLFPQFKRTMKLKLPSDNTKNIFMNDDDDDDDSSHPRAMSDVELSDPEEGVARWSDLHSSIKANPPTSPSLENARQFAHTLLAETERRKSSQRSVFNDEGSVRSTSSMKWPRRGRRNEFQGLRAPPQSDPDDLDLAIGQLTREGISKARSRRRQLVGRFCFFLVTVSIIVCVSVFAHRAHQAKSNQSMENSDRLSATMDALSQRRITSRIVLQDQSSPQYQAARWIAEDDEEQLNVPMNSDSDADANSYRFVQRYILAVLYFSWNGPEWTKQLNFVSSLHECSWFETMPDERGQFFAMGVTCHEQLQVRTLLFASNNLEGTIPPEISHLTSLDFLSLKQNSLTGSIPPNLKQLSNLDFLDLKYNLLTGTIPEFFGELSRLEVLGLSHNQFTGRVPHSLGSLNLLTLAIDDNILTGDLSPVASMTKLEYLYGSNNQFKARLDGGLLANLTHLVEVDLSGNSLQASSIPGYLFSRPTLRVLDLHANHITGTLPDTIPENNVLQFLSLRDNTISSSIPSQIYQLRKLTHLDLEGNDLTGILPARELAQMTSLSYLFLGKNHFQSGTIPSELHTLLSLRELSLDSLQLTGTIPTWIEKFSKLKLLDLRSNSLTGSIALDFAKLPELSYLMVSDNDLSGRVPESLGTQSNLFVVAFHHNNITGDAGQLCQAGTRLLTTDCEDIQCSCCLTCCDGTSCYQDLLWDMLEYSQGLWEENFVRSNYAFNPHILLNNKDSKGQP